MEPYPSLRQPFPLQAAVHPPPGQGIEHRTQGHGEEHPHQAEGVAPQGHRRQHPDARQPHGLAHHPGIDDVALDLLQDHQEDHEPQGLDGVHQQDEQGPDGHPDEGAEDGDQGGEAHQHGDHPGIGQAEEQHPHKAQAAQDHRLGELAGHEVGEGLVGHPGHLLDPLGPGGGEHRVDHLGGLAGEGLLLGQEIQGESQPQHQVEDQGDHRGGHPDGGGDGGVQELLPVLLQEGEDALLELLAVEGEVGEIGPVVGQEGGQLVPPPLEVEDPLGEQVGEVHHAVPQGGDDDEEQGKQGPDDDQDAHQQAHRPPGPVLPGAVALAPQAAPAPLHRAEEDVHQKGQAPSQQEGEEQGEKAGQQPAGLPRVGEDPGQHHPEGDEQQQPFHVLAVQVHGNLLCREAGAL